MTNILTIYQTVSKSQNKSDNHISVKIAIPSQTSQNQFYDILSYYPNKLSHYILKRHQNDSEAFKWYFKNK